MHTKITFNVNGNKRYGEAFFKSFVPFILLLGFLTCSSVIITAQDWFGVHVATGLDGSVMRPMSVGSYDMVANKTIVGFLGEDSHVYVAECDHNNNNTWSAPVLIANSPTSMSAKYAYPQLVQTPDGYIHVFYSKHTTNIWYARSSKPHDISSWDVRDITNEAAQGSSDFSKLRPAYPKVLLGRDGFIYLFWRQSTDVDYIRHASYTVSKNSGETWEPARFMITPIRADKINETYVGQITVEPRRAGVPERFHFVYILAGGPEGHNQYHKNLYHAIWQPGNGHFYSLKGEDLGPVLDSPEMDSRDCLVRPTETSKTSIGYTHTVGVNDKGEPIVDETWIYDGDKWVENAGGSQLDIDDSPSFLQWEDGRMLAYGDRFVLYESFDMGNNWNQVASASARTGNTGVSTRTVPITKPAHPAAKVWVKEQKVNSSNNVLTVFGKESSKGAGKIILKSNYPSIPLGGRCTIQAFITDLSNAKVTNASNVVNFTIEGNGTLSKSSATAVNGLATIEFIAENTDEVVIVRATSSDISGDYTEIYVGNGLLENTTPNPPEECQLTISSAQFSSSTNLLTVQFSSTGTCSNVNAAILNQSGNSVATLSNVVSGFSVNISEECSQCTSGKYTVRLSNSETQISTTFDYAEPRDLEIISVSPSSTHSLVNIQYYSPVEGNVSCSVLNASDQEVIQLNDAARVGTQNEIEIDLSGQVPGTYTIQLSDGSTDVTANVERLQDQASDPMKIISYSEGTVIDYFKIQFSSSLATSVTAELLDEDNNVVQTEQLDATPGDQNVFALNLENVVNGSYNCRLNDGTTILNCGVEVHKVDKMLEILKSFPNPTKDLFAIELTVTNAMVITVSVFDEAEQLEFSTDFSLNNGTNKMVLDLTDLAAGVYSVEFNDGTTDHIIAVTKE